jgi:hypothetical protein
MAEDYNPLRDLGELVATAIAYSSDVHVYADRIASWLGLGEDDSGEVVAEVLSKALGLPACNCVISGGDLIPFACALHGVPCEDCGGLEGCAEDCGEAEGDPAGTVTDLRSQEPRTVTRDGGELVIPALRLDAAGCELLRKILVNEGPALAVAAAERRRTGGVSA